MATSTPLLSRRRVIAARAEVFPGRVLLPTATHGRFNVFNPEFIQPDIPFEDREGQGGFSPLAGVPGARSGKITFTIELAGSGQPSAPVPAWAETFLPACGWVEGGTTGSGLGTLGAFSPQSLPPGASGAGTHTLTIGQWIDGKLRVLRGCMGSFRIVMTAGVPIRIEFTFTGVWDKPEDADLIAPNYPDVTPLRFADADITLGVPGSGSGAGSGEWHPTLQEIIIEAGNDVQLREDPEDVSAYQCAMITGRRVTVSMNPEMSLAGTKDHDLDWLERTLQTLAIEVPAGGSADGNHVKVDAPALQIVNVQAVERNGYVAETVEGLCVRSADAGDDELVIEFA